MAEVVAPGQDPDTPPTQPRRLHGKKRAADGQLESEQRLSKRFDLLNPDNGTRLYLPVASSSDAALTPGQRARQAAEPVPVPAAPKTETKRPRPPPPDDCMQVEDTPHRVYIADLDAELSDIESDEDNPIFLQDIEKHLAKIPKHVLTGPEPKPTKDNQLILYNVPSSLTVPEAQDSVRKAIVEARGRIRERQTSRSGTVEPATAPAATSATEIPPPSFDSDAMDID
ncbi:uncharacterized protein CC84DRAFT_1162708 [Paraphaeosphaeria sporulosa]|uniref:Uncharacterized protein n=1 Tax=Paraphaeosphaeria sporulosa TaxID=1460663 RepID=A0A177CNL6_9PLEO|nr:uncharacterized protein CC84DRAFT_1162708 [Paraphaeosphaeria sporulosa]OAG08876.1 hypothetical protein CC84DRAFT_1162708 [Paraphaeosphaeria sporulosa]